MIGHDLCSLLSFGDTLDLQPQAIMKPSFSSAIPGIAVAALLLVGCENGVGLQNQLMYEFC